MKTIFLFIVLFISSLSFNSCVVHSRKNSTKNVVVHKLPKIHKVVYIKGHRYYKWNGKHYRKTRKGYIVVRV